MATNSSLRPHQPDDVRLRRRASGLSSNSVEIRPSYDSAAGAQRAADAVGTIGPIDDDGDDDDDEGFGDVTGWDVFWLVSLIILLCLSAAFVLVSPFLILMGAWWWLFA